VDPVVVSAVVAAVSAVVGPPVTWHITRRRTDTATVELTEAQAEQIRAQIWASINDTLRAEIIRLQGRITDLEQRLAALDAALRAKDVQLAGVQAERDQLRIQLAAAVAHLQERERQVEQLRAQLAVRRNP
jgi:hypothetical protein